MNAAMKRDSSGRFIKGFSYSPATQFKKGRHWRTPKPYWSKDWMVEEYVMKQRTCRSIAEEFGVRENAIQFWLSKHGIAGRSVSEEWKIRPRPGFSGTANPMYGRTGINNPHWKGGVTPCRQSFYSSLNWKRFSRTIKRRDKCCRLCSSVLNLEIHHIEPFRRAPLLVMDEGNAILLCKPCHRKLQGKELRWRKRLYALIEKGDNE